MRIARRGHNVSLGANMIATSLFAASILPPSAAAQSSNAQVIQARYDRNNGNLRRASTAAVDAETTSATFTTN